MNAKLALSAVLATAVTLTSVAAAGPEAAKQRVGATMKNLPPFARGNLSRTVEGVRFSFVVPRTGWENGPIERVGRTKSRPLFRIHSLLISKSTVGGQSAEAVLFWTSFPAGGEATPCATVLGSAIGRSTDALARAIARAPGTRLVEGPTRVTVGGRPARKVVVTVRRHVGCDPGFFFGWQAPECWGACWLEASVGDKVTLWIVGVHGKRLVIEAETTQPGSHGRPPGTPVTRADALEVEAEIEAIVESIRFR